MGNPLKSNVVRLDDGNPVPAVGLGLCHVPAADTKQADANGRDRLQPTRSPQDVGGRPYGRVGHVSHPTG